MLVESRPLDDSFACEVVGLHLWEPQDDQTVGQLRHLWTHRPVLVFRRQALSEHELAGFSALFGPLERVRPLARHEGLTGPGPPKGVASRLLAVADLTVKTNFRISPGVS